MKLVRTCIPLKTTQIHAVKNVEKAVDLIMNRFELGKGVDKDVCKTTLEKGKVFIGPENDYKYELI